MVNLFLAFADLTCHLEDTGIGVFWFPVPPDSKETELGSSDQEVSPSAGKNTRVVLVSPLGNSDHVVFSVLIDFPSNSQQDALFYRIAYDYSCADSDLGMMHWQ